MTDERNGLLLRGLHHARKIGYTLSAVFATILPEPLDEFRQSGIDSRPWVVSKLLDGLRYIRVGALDVAGLSGKEFISVQSVLSNGSTF